MRRIGLVLVLLWLPLWTIPTSVGAQPGEKIARVAILSGSQRSPTGYREFLDELRALGWVEGRNLVFEARVAEGRYERLPSLTEEILKWQPHVICTTQTPATQAAMKATSTIPIVMMGNGDPVRYGLVKSLARPEANVTGTAWLPNELSIKLLEMLREALPKATRVAALANPNNPGWTPFVEDLRVASPRLGVSIEFVAISNEADLDRALGTFTRKRYDALLASPEAFVLANRQRILEVASTNRLPVLGTNPTYAEPGALITFSPHSASIARQNARQVDKLLRGARPGDVPVELPERFELVINLKTAKALGLTIPPSLLLRADQVIE
jgi:putative ABC transport system substrate-binding protein